MIDKKLPNLPKYQGRKPEKIKQKSNLRFFYFLSSDRPYKLAMFLFY